MKIKLILLFFLLCLAACSEQQTSPNQELEDARSALTAKDYIEAEKSFDRYLRRYPEGEERWAVWNNLVDLTLDVRQDQRMAFEMLEAMLVEFENDPPKMRHIIIRLGEKYHELRKWEQSARVWVLMLHDKGASQEEKALAYRRMASAYLARLEFESAREALGYCVNLTNIKDNTRAMCSYELAEALVVMEDLDAAEKTLNGLLKQNNVPDATRVLATFMLADVLDQRGKSSQARVLFESVLNTYPNRQVVEVRLGKNENPKPTFIPPSALENKISEKANSKKNNDKNKRDRNKRSNNSN